MNLNHGGSTVKTAKNNRDEKISIVENIISGKNLSEDELISLTANYIQAEKQAKKQQ